jgi:AAA domain/DnaB-like helicase N terminal domain
VARAPTSPIDSVRVEAAVLGAVLLDNALWSQAAPLDSGDFSLPANGIIYSCMRDLVDTGRPVDMITLSAELEQHGELNPIGGVAYLSSLIDGLPDRPSIEHYVKMIRGNAGARHVAHGTEAICELARIGADVSDLRAHLADLDRLAGQYESSNSPAPIRGFDSVPDLLTLQIDPMDYVVQGLLPRKSLVLWTGIDGTAKTYLAQNLAIAVSTGGKFLGAQCRKMPVIYLDYENPDFVVRARLELMGAEPNTNLKIWGTWLPEQPPQIGNQLLLTIAKEVQPLMIVDPFRYSHGAEENDSTAMMAIMKDLRSYVVAGATVTILHHPSKVEGSTGRGSTAIRGAVDLAYLQELSDETGLITLRCVKNRFGERPVLTIRPDFEEGAFELTDSPRFTKKMADVDALAEIIRANPGATQNRILEKWGGNKNHGISLLKEYNGSRWDMVKDGQSFRYSQPVQESCTGLSTGVPVGSTQGVRETGTPVHTPIGVYRSVPVDLGPSESVQPVCAVHGVKADFWSREDGSQVCGLCHPKGRIQ